jgi:hypothetical protein
MAVGVGAKRLTEPWSGADTFRLTSVPWLGNKCVKGISCAQPPLYTDVHLVEVKLSVRRTLLSVLWESFDPSNRMYQIQIPKASKLQTYFIFEALKPNLHSRASKGIEGRL